MAIAIFIVSSSSLVICVGLKDEIAPEEQIFGYRRSLARPPKAGARAARFFLSFAHAGAQIFA
jgi:hypothetical protein